MEGLSTLGKIQPETVGGIGKNPNWEKEERIHKNSTKKEKPQTQRVKPHQQKSRHFRNDLIFIVGAEGFEPPTLPTFSRDALNL